MKKNFFYRIILPLSALAVVVVLGIASGSAKIDWQNLAHDPILELRLIRVAAAFVVGSSLALAGLLLQAVLRNVLAEPFTLGISGGASVGAALAITLGWHTVCALALPGMAVIFALLLLGLVLLLSAGKGAESMLLSGVIAGTVASSILMYIVSVSDRDDLAGLTWWMLGDLQVVETKMLCLAGGFLLLALFLIRYFARELNAVAMGSLNAWSMGVDHRKYTLFFVVIGSVLAAQTVALAGLIAFVGLIVPHLVRRFYGGDHRYNIWPVGLWGGIFLILCDWLSRVVCRSSELPIGVMTSLVGGSMFIYLLNKRRG